HIPDIVIVGAQRGGDGMSQWLQKIHAQNKTVVSVCTGAFKLAEAGLLDGKPATTHHWYFGDMQTQHPAVKLVREVRYVQSDPTTYTAGGLTSGVDLSLHLVAERFGQDVAQQTADYMEYQGTGWKTNQGISQLTTPIKREDWSGTLGSGAKVIVHLVTEGASTSATADIPAQQVKGVTTRLGGGNGKSSIAFNIAGHPATFEGKGNADGSQLDGIFQQDGKETPLVLTRDR
ncbi:DJ-1/PfpI family protein, partial [Dyella sp.]|uniref:DJ-1/PfpI family protein n=1 Tax=Dyella sp. TaxID=1869338 RepID=UPI002ECFDF23